MIYIKKNAENEIIGIEFNKSEGFTEASLFDDEVKAFLANQNNEKLIKQTLNELDHSMVRVIEDLIETMIDKGLMLFTDLPEPVQNKLMFKKSLRQSLNYKENSSYYLDDDIQF